MALGRIDSRSKAELARELQDWQLKLSNTSESLKNERKLCEIKERTIQNLKQEIRVIDKDSSEKKREIEKLNEIVQHLRSKVTSLETENKKLKSQATVVQDLNRKLNKDYYDARNSLLERENEAAAANAQRGELCRKYTHALRDAADRCKTFTSFLQQLQADGQSRDVLCKRLQTQRLAIEDALDERNAQGRRFSEHGWYGLFPLRTHSHVLLEDEKSNLKQELEKVCSAHAPLVTDGPLMRELVQSVENSMSECLKSRLGVQDNAITEAQKKLRGVRVEVRQLKNLEYEQLEATKKTGAKVAAWTKLFEGQLKELNDELSTAQANEKSGGNSATPVRKFSVGCDSRIRSLSVAGKTSREEIVEIKKAISSLVSKTEASDNPLSDMEERILSLNQKLTRLIEEKIVLSDELISSQNSLINVENLLGRQTNENATLSKQLSAQRKVLQEAESNLQCTLQGKIEIERKLNATSQELQKTRKEAQSNKDKLDEHAHRVEVNFTPRPQITRGGDGRLPRDAGDMESQESPIGPPEGLPKREFGHKSVQVDSTSQHAVVSSQKSSDKRRGSAEFPRRERRLSKAEVKLTFRCHKETQVDTMTEEGLKIARARDEEKRKYEAMEKLNQELLSGLRQREDEVKELQTQIQKLNVKEPGSDEQEPSELRREKNGSETEHDDHQRQDRAEILDLQETLGNLLLDNEALREQNDQLKKDLESRESQMTKLLEKEPASKVWLEPGMELMEKQAKVSSILTQMEEKIQLEAEKDSEFFGEKLSKQLEVMQKMRQKTEYLEKKNKEVEKELDEQRRLVHSLRIQRADLQTRTKDQNEIPLDQRSIFKEEILQLQSSVNNTVLQKEDIENKLKDLRDEMGRIASSVEAQENEWYETQVSGLRKEIEETLEEKRAVENEIETMETEIHRRRLSRITAEVNEFERKHSLSFPEGTDTRKMIRDLKEAIQNAQDNEQKARTRVRELERELADKKELISAYQSEDQISPEDIQVQHLFGGITREKGNEEDRKLRQEFRLLNQEIATLRRRVEIREKNLESKVKELAQKEFLIQKIIHEKNREMEEMEIKFKCRLQEQLEKLHKELTNGADFFSQAAKEENSNLKEKLNHLQALMERDQDSTQQKCASLEKRINTLEQQKLELENQRRGLKSQTLNLNFQLKKSEEKVRQVAEDLSLAEKKCAELETALEPLRHRKSELSAKLQSIVDEKSKREYETQLEQKEAEKELNESRTKCRRLEDNAHELERVTSALADQVARLEQQCACLETDNLCRDEQISHLKEELDNATAERNTLVTEKSATVDLLNRRVQEMETMALDTRRAQQQDQEKLGELRGKLQEVEMKYAVVKEENQRLEKELKGGTEKIFQLQRELSDAQAEAKTHTERNKSLSAQISRLKDVSNEKDDSLRREERLRMENMKTLDALKIKLEKSEVGDKRQRERLFSLKSACSEANEAYEIVKKQNVELRNDLKELKKKLEEQDLALETSHKEKDTLEEQILSASRSIEEMKKFSRYDRVSPDSALGISIASYASDLSSGPNSPNSEIRDDMSDSAFLAEAADEKFDAEFGDVLGKMPGMIENFRAVVTENENIRNRLGALLLGKEKVDGQVLEFSQANTTLRKENSDKNKRVAALESKIKVLEDDLLDTASKANDLERCLAASTGDLEFTEKKLAERDDAIKELQEKMELLDEREKALELYSKSVSEKYKYEESEKKKLEDISHKMERELREHKQRIAAIDSKLAQPKSEENGLLAIAYPDATDGVSMETTEGKLEALFGKLDELETSLSAVQSDNIELQREIEELQQVNDELRGYEALSKEYGGKIQDLQVRDQVATGRITQLENQNEMLEGQNKEHEDAIEEYKQNDEELEKRVKIAEYSVRALERANEAFRDETEKLRENLRQSDESCTKKDLDLSSATMKLSELEITNEAYKAENLKLQQDLKDLSEAKCEVECRISEAERQERKLHETIEEERKQKVQAEKKRTEVQENCDQLYQEQQKSQECMSALEGKLAREKQEKEKQGQEAMRLTSENTMLADQLGLVTKNLSEMEEKLKNSTVQREKLEQQLSIGGLETAKLTSAYESSVRRKQATERSLVEANARNEELEVYLEEAKEEKASLLKDAAHKEQQLQQLQSLMGELNDDKQKLVNDLYFGTRKVLTMQQELEALRGDANLLGKELRGIIQGSLGKERISNETGGKEGDDATDYSHEAAAQTLKQNVRVTERMLEAIRPDARITDLESKSCQREVDGIRKEFTHLKEQLRNYKQQSQKLAGEVKKVREDSASKHSNLLETKEKYNTMKDENLETRGAVNHLQNKVAELEGLMTEYENKAEKGHAEVVRANQHIASLEANLARSEQKKIAQEKELLVANEKITNLEANSRAMKDDGRNDKKKIASLEVESSEKQALARELEKTDADLTELRFKYGDLLKEKEEAKTELALLREESSQEQRQLKTTKKQATDLKKTLSTEKDLRSKAQQDLAARNEQCETYKKNLSSMERSLAKLQSDNACLEEKVKLLEAAGMTLNRETEIQNVEMRRLEDALKDMKNNLHGVSRNYEGCEKERRRLTEELIAAQEKISKLQGTCAELLKEKENGSAKLASMNEALEVAVSNKEDLETGLKQELMLTRKELSVTSSSLERSQNKVELLLQETKNNEAKIKALEEKKQDALGKYWAGVEELTEAEADIHNLRKEIGELRGKCGDGTQKIQMLQKSLDEERDDNEKETATWNEKMSKIKSLNQKLTEERDFLKQNLEETQGALEKTNEDLELTGSTLRKKEQFFKDEVGSRDELIEDLATQNMEMKDDFTKTKSALKEARLDNSDLRERLNITTDKVERLERTLEERNNEIEDLLAEAHAKLNVVKKMKVSSTEDSFAELPAVAIEPEESGMTSNKPPKTSMREVVTSYHRACLASLNDCRTLQEKLTQAKQDSERLEDNLQRERGETTEIKKALHDVQKKRAKSDEDVKRLRRRLESFKAKSLEAEKERENEITEVRGDKLALEKDLWETKENLEQVKARLKSIEEEKDRYVRDLESSRKTVVGAKNEIKSAQSQLDFLQENILQLKKRIFELEAAEKFAQQQLQETEKELHTTQMKVQELEQLNSASSKKKTELYQEVAKAQEKIGSLEGDSNDKSGQITALERKMTTMKATVGELETNLEKARADLQASRKECDGLETHRVGLRASNDALKQQVEAFRNESNGAQRLLGKMQEENAGLKQELVQTRSANEELRKDNMVLEEERESAKKELQCSGSSLRSAEGKLVKSFQENENLKRQHIKSQSSACADLAQKQLEVGKLKAETSSLKQELIEKDKALNDVQTKSKVIEKENEFLKKELGDIHHQKSDLKLDLNTTTSKLQSYVMERECWEREVKTVLAEIDKQKSANQSKEQRLERMRTRYEQEVKFLQQRAEGLERELRVMHEGNEQQRHADEIAYKLAMESKDMELDNLKLRLQTTRLHANDKSNVLDVMKGQLDQRSAKIQELTDQIKCLKESYQLEVASLQAELKASQAESLLHTRADTSYDNSVGELLDEIQSSRKESDRLRRMLGSKMTEMKSLNNEVTAERTGGARNTSLSKPYLYSKSPRRSGLAGLE